MFKSLEPVAKPQFGFRSAFMRQFLRHAWCLGIFFSSSLYSEQPSFFSKQWPVVDEIVKQMTIDQKIGQVTLVPIQMLYDENNHFDPSLIQKYYLGAVFNAASEAPDGAGGVISSTFGEQAFSNATLENYQEISKVLMEQTVEIPRLQTSIPILLGIDAIHGNQHVLGSVLFPHNIGLAAAHDPELMFWVGYWTAYDTLKSGFNWIFAPTTNIAFNYQWGRTYETMGAIPEEVEKNSAAFVRGAQMLNNKKKSLSGVLATTKHFMGLGGAFQGADEGDTLCENSLNSFIKSCFCEFKGGLSAQTGSIMCAYNGVNNIPMSIHHFLLNDVLKGGKITRMPFKGFVVSDYESVSKAALQGLPTSSRKISYEEALKRSLLSGMDMFMISPYGPHKNIAGFQSMLKKLIIEGAVPMSRLDDAVRRILAVKCVMGLIQKDAKTQKWVNNRRPGFPELYQTESGIKKDPESEKWKMALKAAEESLVLLKNNQDLLPVNPAALKYIVLVGQRIVPVQIDDAGTVRQTLFQDYDNIGAQNGGWTVRWQGFEGNGCWQGDLKEQAHARSLLDGLSEIVKDHPQIQLLYPRYSSFTDLKMIEKESALFFASLKNIPDFSPQNTLIVATLAESPYSEFMGDVNISYCRNNDHDAQNGCLYNNHYNAYAPKQQRNSLMIHWDSFSNQVIELVKQNDAMIPIVTVLFSGRPMLIDSPLASSTAFISAWLPGTTGGKALANALFGKYLFCQVRKQANTLPVDWLKSMDQLHNFPYFSGDVQPQIKDPLFPKGFGLSTHDKK